MPIRPERKHLYPANWKTEIVPMLKERSGDCCEACGVKNGAIIWRNRTKSHWTYADILRRHNLPQDASDNDLRNSLPMMWNIKGNMQPYNKLLSIWFSEVKIILTGAHINHDETDNRPENLAYWCQLHHNRHDAKHRAANRRPAKDK